jgi:ascorbate-specific PTS system EIIC-type component UlaA
MNRSNPNRKALLISCAAFLIQGGWAVYANHESGWERSLPAGLVQGLCSFAMTYLSTLLMEYILLAASAASAGWRFVAASGGTFLFITAVQSLAHWLAGTPHIARTILPAVIVGAIYCVVYSSGRVFFGRGREGRAVAQQGMP